MMNPLPIRATSSRLPKLKTSFTGRMWTSAGATRSLARSTALCDPPDKVAQPAAPNSNAAIAAK